ncbi:hypothetical protein M405DRAFT_780480 [Rhizopogon salebrosus TDB-379]|nr:hypothetical protein M405DRAFT_780480 [Rhizopogon salebrosus TDB-379]
MGKGNPQKKHWELKKSHSNLRSPRHYGAVTAASTSEPSLYPHVQLGSPRASRGLFHKLWDRLFKSHSNGGAHQTPKPVTPPVVTANSSGQDISLARTSQAPSPTTAPTPDGNPGQATNPGTVSSEVGLSHAGAPDPKESIAVAYDAAAVMSGPSGMIENITSATDDGRSGLQTIDNFSSIIEPLKVFNTIANQIANIHPYSQVVMSIFTGVSKMILNQKELDNAVRGLLEKISGIYTFMNEDGRLDDVLSIQALCAKMARQILECAVFITHYSQTTNFWKRLGKHIVDETDAAVGIYNGVLDSLLQQFRDRVTRDTVVHVHHMVEDMDFRDMAYADGAGWETSKCCLTGTREDILSRIRSWIDTTGRDVQRVLWLSGTAGKGKSAIAHTIAEWFYERSGTGACFCFDSTRGADRHHEKIFTTIARDLADRDPVIRRALASAVHDNELRRTKDIKRQWKKLILGPVDAVSKVIDAPVLIIIDALDESGDANFRQQVLCLLASPPTELPANFRVLVTSRPLKDIHDSLPASRVLCLSLDDDISPKSAESDIQHYISGRLGNMCDVFSEADFQMLAQKADGLFEWARLACEYIQHTNTVGRGSKSRFEAVVSQAAGKETPVKGTRLLDDMYRCVLGEILPEEDREEAIPLFCSVMGQILASQEPLPKAALTAMRSHFPRMDSRYTVDDVIGPMGSLVTGTGDSQTPIRPLHASFYDFLTDKSRSDKFFIDVPSVQADLAFASLQVMKHGLRFNICSLESSYLPNSDVSDLEKRVKESIVPELSYSCRFWGTHAGATPIEPLLAKEVKAFFDGDHLLFWIEALSLLKSVGSAVQTLSSVADWCQVRDCSFYSQCILTCSWATIGSCGIYGYQ